MNSDKNTDSGDRDRVARAITDEALNKFLAWLSPDSVEAGQKYREIHACLVAIFIRRGYADAEEMADKTIDRVIRRIARDDSFKGEDYFPYFIRVAYHLHVERQGQKSPVFQPPPETDDSQELEDLCLERCLQRLGPGERELILQYYQDDKRAKIDRRKRLAEEHGLTVEALRLKIHRIRASLRPCIEECLAKMKNS